MAVLALTDHSRHHDMRGVGLATINAQLALAAGDVVVDDDERVELVPTV
ncbi:MAG: hypothetical protein ABJE66_34115 [Deltaproteobacteria bacterium]